VLISNNRVTTLVQTYRVIKVTDLVWFSLTQLIHFFFLTDDCYTYLIVGIYLVTFIAVHHYS